MNVEFVPINYLNTHDCTLLSKWFNDDQISYLISPNFQPGKRVIVTPEQISKLNAYPKNEKFAFFIVCDHVLIGDINITDNPDYLLKKGFNSCWLGITIGEKKYQGLGIGKLAMQFIEDFAIDNGFNRIELGVFSYNKRAIDFYKKLGYKHFGTIPNFTFYNGLWYDDLRFEKLI